MPLGRGNIVGAMFGGLLLAGGLALPLVAQTETTPPAAEPIPSTETPVVAPTA